MQIRRSRQRPELADRLMADIALAAGGQGIGGRVCGDACPMSCVTCGSKSCQCRCAPDCPDAPYALSGDPGAYPIEPGIVGLVYAMTSSGLFETCWSCEGHSHADGTLWKVPAVWFYCDAMVHVRLLADGLARLSFQGRLKASWQISITYSDPGNPRTTFALEPALARSDQATLLDLQRDIAQIGLALRAMIAAGGAALQRA